MIGKPITGKSFGGCVRYLVGRPEATILQAEGVRIESANKITLDFNQQRKLNPNLGRAVGHTILSWSAEDKGKLNDEMMTEVAMQYMKKMGIVDTQFLIVKHTDREHPHLHLIYNRVNNQGRTISDQNNYKRNVSVCRQLTEAYGFHLGQGKEQVNRQRLRGRDDIKYRLHDAIKAALKIAGNWQEMELQLQSKGIGVHFIFKGQTDKVQGISFSKNGITMKGSAIDRAFSFTKLDEILGDEMKPVSRLSNRNTEGNQLLMEGKSVLEFVPGMGRNSAQNESLLVQMLDIAFRDEHLYEAHTPAELDLRRKKKKKKKQYLGRSI